MANINPNPNSTSIQFILNGNAFLYGSTGFKMLGYLYDSNPGYLINRSIGYFKAQLAFRGYSNRGHNIEALKVRLRGAGNAMDERVMSLGEDMKRQWEDGAEQAARGNQREAVPNLELAKNDPVQFLRTWFFHENESPDHNAQVVIFPEQYRAGSMNWMKASQQIIGGYPQLMSMPVHDQGEMLEIVS